MFVNTFFKFFSTFFILFSVVHENKNNVYAVCEHQNPLFIRICGCLFTCSQCSHDFSTHTREGKYIYISPVIYFSLYKSIKKVVNTVNTVNIANTKSLNRRQFLQKCRFCRLGCIKCKCSLRHFRKCVNASFCVRCLSASSLYASPMKEKRLN